MSTMSSVLDNLDAFAAAPVAAIADGGAIYRSVQLALACSVSDRRGLERRRETRHPFPFPVSLTPLDNQGRPLTDETFTVLGKTLGEQGFDFFHLRPLAYRNVIASLPDGQGGWRGILMDLAWCRFCQYGWYDSGGRFLEAVESPLTTSSRKCG
jgi:hypothetical protein